jgi:hypothetical protein
MRRLNANTTFRVTGGIHAVEAAPAELPVIQVVPFGATGVTIELNTAHYNTSGFHERERATARLAYAEAVVLVEALEQILAEAGAIAMHARIAARAAQQRQRAQEESFDPRQLDLLEVAA